MDALTKYNIPFTSLEDGIHNYDYHIDSEFFEEMGSDLLAHGAVDVKVELNKSSAMLIFEFSMKGQVELTCDKCADDYMQPIEGNDKLIVKFGPESKEESEEVIVLAVKENVINMAQHIYEAISTLVPLWHRHPKVSQCNQDTLKVLNQLAQKPAKEEIDPRWAALKNLKDEN